MKKADQRMRIIVFALCEVFTIFTIVMLLITKRYDNLPLAIGTVFMILIPATAERLFHCQIALPIYIYALFYSIGPMIGESYRLYYLVNWWDKLLHMSGGVIFALFGLFLFEQMNCKSKQAVLFGAIFAVCFSMSVSLEWEFLEFGSDQLLGTDMQQDTVVTSIHSYKLGDEVDVVGEIANITEVTVHEVPLPINGYLDIGLIDTMLDTLLESLGAWIVSLFYIIDKGKHKALSRVDVQGE